MARKGGAQQLQTEIKTDDELEKFLTRPGLLILEVYSEWCGPCLGLLGTLRRVKLEMGGDNLQLATCRADTITSLKRFYKKSEPTWLFVTNGRAVNLFLGADAPKLVDLIVKELEKASLNISRPTYNISDLQPIEAEALRIKTEALQKAERAEFEKKEKKRLDYLMRCTDVIMENLPDIGVTVFGPQVSRDMFKKLSEPAEHLKMQCKDRKYLEVSTADFDVVNFACKNPLSPDIIEQLNGKELLMCFWKIDESAGAITNVLAQYAHELTKERVAPPDDEINVPHPIPPIIAPLKIKFEVEVEDGEVWVEEVSSEEEARKAAEQRKLAEKKSVTQLHDETRGKDQDGAEDIDEEEGTEEEEVVQTAQPAATTMGFDIDMGLDVDAVVSEEEMVEEEEEPPKPLTRTKRVKIPPIWVANNRRTHAALILVFFRGQTGGFLPPDPPPEPPHIVMAFEANKRDDIMEVVDGVREDVPQYGFFTNDTPGEAKLITNSIYKYDELKDSTPNDRFVLKVNKVQSYTMLSLVQFEPTYCSNDVKVGRTDALKFFPEDYKVDEEIPADEKRTPKKKKKTPATVEPVEEPAGSRKPSLDQSKSAEVPAEAATEEAPKASEGQEPPAEAATAEGQPPTEAAAAVADPAAAAAAEGEGEAAPVAGEAVAAEQPPPKEETPAAAEPAAEAPAADTAAPAAEEASTAAAPAPAEPVAAE
ncbi:uncharacterized protein LOC132796500 [Drosophila nasuta]|uniref:uncharacterized protein LOC132796500 n=1 Tax=Drosophila nasuta TaxID=42062 RepID=UPI00295EE2C8|nr:uncharacterized protein LOC132796500 [Drosophila nasuta]